MQLPPGYLSKCVTHYVEAFERLIVSVAQKKSNDVWGFFCKLGYTAQILIQNDKIMFASNHLRESGFWYSPNIQPGPLKSKVN